MKKLAFIINVFREDNFHSGGERLFYELAKEAINKGFIVDLYCCKHLYSEGSELLEFNRVVKAGNAKFFKFPQKIENLFSEFKILIEKEAYNHIISENITPPLDTGILQGHSAKHYVDMSGNIFSKMVLFLKKHDFIKYQQKWFKQGYKKIFVPSKVLKNEFKKNFNIEEEKFVIAYPGVDLSERTLISDIDKNNLRIGLSAPSFKNKGGYVFLKALKILKTKGYNIKAKIIYPKFRKNLFLKLYIKLLGLENQIEFLPHQKNMSDFYNSVDCVVMPSILETFGLVGLEAMSNGKIAIISSFCGMSEIIDDGVSGFVFDMSKQPHKSLSNKIEQLIKTDNLKEICENSLNTAKEFSWQKSTKTILDNLD